MQNKRTITIIIGIFILGSIPFRLESAPNKPSRISRITIRSTDIFDFETKPYLKKFPYNWINILHIQTNERIIEQEILFKIGENVDDFLIEETERNLRALPFIRSARIVKFPQRDGTTVLVVHANDSWTTEPQLNLEGINSVDDLELGFKEKNLFGWGKSVEFIYRTDSEIEFEERVYRYTDPRLFGSRWLLKGELVDKTDGKEDLIEVSRPFYSADTPFSTGGSFHKNEEIIEEFGTNNKKISEFDQTKENTDVFVRAKIGGGRRIVNRGGLRYTRENQDFARNKKTAVGRAIPKAQRFQTIFFDFQSLHSKYKKMSRVEKMTRIEDINLGPILVLSPGYSPKSVTGRKDASQFEAFLEQSGFLGRSHLLRVQGRHASRQTFENATNQRNEVSGKYYHRHSPLQTFVVHSRVEWGKELDSDNQIHIGGNNGLRGFEFDSIVGSKSFLLNLEDRLYFTDEVWNLFSLGAVVFFDTGYSWPSGHPVSPSDLRSDIGAGLRMGLTRSSNELIVRLDVAYRLHRINSDDREFVVAFGSGQAF